MLVPPSGPSLPVVTTLADCAHFSKTVAPYLQQLYTSPTRLSLETLTNVEALRHLYITTNPIASALVFSVLTFPIFFIVSEVNKNYSQVDRVWSILPTLFNAHYAIWARLNGLPTSRVDNVIAFSVLWSVRLTFNYWRKGGYSVGSEDYRWALIKKYIGSFGFILLNVVFISTLQIIILLAITTPTYILLLVSRLSPTISPAEYWFTRTLLLLIVTEYFADGQQWNYHSAKHSYQSTAKVPSGWTRAQMDRGFLTTGLWRFSRHPNFAAEQTVWLTLYLWGAYASGQWWNWTVGGVISYSLVFQGSTPITEWISQGKYPEYRLYRQKVGRFVPSILNPRGWDEKEMEKVGLEERKKSETRKKADGRLSDGQPKGKKK